MGEKCSTFIRFVQSDLPALTLAQNTNSTSHGFSNIQNVLTGIKANKEYLFEVQQIVSKCTFLLLLQSLAMFQHQRRLIFCSSDVAI